MSFTDLNIGVTVATDPPTFSPFELNTDDEAIYETFFNPDMNYIDSISAKLLCNYFTETQLNTFSTFHLNIRSLPKNYDCLSLYQLCHSHFQF